MAEAGTITIAAKVAVEMVKAAKEAGLIDKLIDAFRKKNRVMVLGSSGVGKTNLRDSLTKETSQAVDRLTRTDFVKRHHIRINKTPFILADTPGQLPHLERRIDAIREEMARGRFGILNVVCYGYHEGTGSRSKAIDASGKPKQDYLEHCRSLEIQALSEWSSLLGDLKTCDWLITVVNKADLWWETEDAVIDYYTAGPYYKHLGDAQKLRPVVVPYSSTIHKFFGEAPISGQFDINDQLRCKVRLLQALVDATTRSE